MQQEDDNDVMSLPPLERPSPTPPPRGTREPAALTAQAAMENPPSYGTQYVPGHGMAEPSYIYALGKIEARFPTLAIEKEFMQVTGRSGATGQTDQEAFYTALAERSNRYLARKLCWVLVIEGLETYILSPRDPIDLDLLIGAVRPQPSALDVDVVVGLRGPIAPPELCNGLMLPIVIYDQIYSFDAPALVKAIPKPDALAEKQFRPAAQELFDRIMQIADNAGAADEHRALNYLAVRYPAIYATTAEAFSRNLSLTSVDVLPSRLSSTRKIVDVIFSFTHRQTGVIERFFARVDISEEFPFLVTPISPYFSH